MGTGVSQTVSTIRVVILIEGRQIFGDDVKSPEHVQENIATIALTDDEMKVIEYIIANNAVVGDR